jgi:hypothetical protein
MARLTAALAEEMMVDQAIVPAMSGSVPDMKKLRDRCLDAGLPAMIGCPPGAAGRG